MQYGPIDDISAEELSVLGNNSLLLANTVNAYRMEKKLAPIRISPALTFVAQNHVVDLYLRNPHKDGADGSIYSWSDHGSWSRLEYLEDHSNSAGMWSKPRYVFFIYQIREEKS